MSGPELKPCPFCHGTHITDRYVRDGRQMFCQSCGASVAPTYHGPNGDTIERAITAWNTRTLPAQPAPAVGEDAHIIAVVERELGEWECDGPDEMPTTVSGLIRAERELFRAALSTEGA